MLLAECIKTNNKRVFKQLTGSKTFKSANPYLEYDYLLNLMVIHDRLDMLKEFHKLYFNKHGWNVVDTAIIYKRERCLQLLLDLKYKVCDSHITLAARAGNINNLKTLGAILKQFDYEHISSAAFYGHFACVKYIYESIYYTHDPDFNSVLLHHACYGGNYEVFQYIHQFMDETTISYSELITPSIKGGSIDTLKYVMNKHPVTLYENWLLWASEKGHFQMVQYLVDNRFHDFNFDQSISKMFDSLCYEVRDILKDDAILAKKCRNILACFYILLEQSMKENNDVNLSKMKCHEWIVEKFDLDHPVVRTYLFDEKIKLPQLLREAIMLKKEEIKMQVDYLVIIDRVASDIVKYIISTYL